MEKATLLDALSPSLMSLVEASLGQTVQLNKSVPKRLTVESTNPGLSPASRAIPVTSLTSISKLNPSETFILRNKDSPGFIVREGFLGVEDAASVREACETLKQSGTMRDAHVKSGDITTHVAHARGDQLMWLPHDETQLPTAIHHLLRQIEKLVHGLVKAAPELGIRNIRSTQFAIFVRSASHVLLTTGKPGNQTRFVKHVDTYSEKPGLRRCLTCLYYLNPTWDPSHGGALRVHLKDGEVWDVPPVLDTLLLFRSTDVEHEVMPTSVDRWALTTWYYSKPEDESAQSLPRPMPSSSKQLEPLKVQDEPEMNDTIFVSVASFCDSECMPTLSHLFDTAATRTRIFVGVCLQHENNEQDEARLVSAFGPNVRVKCMKPSDATGPCLARWETQQLWQGETYYLQIDSHMRFRRHWDTFLIEQLKKCEAQKPILTTYPMGYRLPNEIPSDVRPTLLCASGFDSHGLLRQCGKVLKQVASKPLPCFFWAAGFAFSQSSVIQEVPYGPSLAFLFFGEENSMAVRLWTHGYDFFAPPEAVVYHLWSRSHRPVFQDTTRANDQREKLAAQSLQRVKDLLEGVDTNPATALGHVRSIQDFQRAMGVHFESQQIEWTALWSQRNPIEFDLSASTTFN
ncbi:unnamed protein product [Aphanomyces euteiches]